MSEIVQKIKACVQSTNRQQGIKGLIKLQAQLPQNMRYKPRVACLHLMQINHDWEAIRKFIVQWKLIKNFGRQLAIRMRKRVGQQPGSISEDENLILKQLDRLNDKNWRQFSPKKKFTDFSQYLTQITNANNHSNNNNSNSIAQTKTNSSRLTNSKISKIPSSQLLKNRNEQKMNKQGSQKQQRRLSSNLGADGGSIFSKLSQIPKLKQKQLATRGVFSKQLKTNIQFTNQKNQSKESSQALKIRQQSLSNNKQNIQLLKNPQNSNSNRNINQTNSKPEVSHHQPPKSVTPSKQIGKRLISIKFGNQKFKQQQKDSKDQFSFSAVKARQIQGFSNKKQGRTDQIDQSFLNFTNQSKLSRKKNQERSQIKSRERDNILSDMKVNRNFQMNTSRFLQSRPLLTEQQLQLIEPNIPYKNHIKNIYTSQGKGALTMLKKVLTD